VRFAGGILLLIFGAVLIPYVSWWALLPLAAAVLNFAWGYWYLTIARSASPENKRQTNENPAAEE
jgi:ABC-type bacteriocin/lantibiotic exporter with double-glycine peptidase domain